MTTLFLNYFKYDHFIFDLKYDHSIFELFQEWPLLFLNYFKNDHSYFWTIFSMTTQFLNYFKYVHSIFAPHWASFLKQSNELIKLLSSGVVRTMMNIGRQEGAMALYSGIVPGLQRQMAFSAIR